MSYMDWDEKYATNIKDIDEQHKKLFTIINKFFDALSNAKGNEVVGEILQEFERYTVEHFSTEEKKMASKNYPDFATHKKYHEECIQKIKEFIAQHKSGKVHISIATFSFLKDWLMQHVLVVDKKYVPFLAEKL